MQRTVTLYRWVTDSGDRHPACLALHGQVRSLGEWHITVMPGFHPGCRARLVQAVGVVKTNKVLATRPVKLSPYFIRLDGGLVTGLRRTAPGPRRLKARRPGG